MQPIPALEQLVIVANPSSTTVGAAKVHMDVGNALKLVPCIDTTCHTRVLEASQSLVQSCSCHPLPTPWLRSEVDMDYMD